MEFGNNHSELERDQYLKINATLNGAGATLLTKRSVHDLLYGNPQEPVAKEILDLVDKVQPEARILDNFGLVMNVSFFLDL